MPTTIEANRERAREHYRHNLHVRERVCAQSKARRQRLVNAGRCPNCGDVAREGKQTCAPCARVKGFKAAARRKERARMVTIVNEAPPAPSDLVR